MHSAHILCRLKWIVFASVCAVRVSLILRCNIPSFTAHNTTTDCSPCASVFAFFRQAMLVSTSKFLRVFHTSQQLLAGFQALKSAKEKSSKESKEKKVIWKTNTATSLPEKAPDFQTFWDFRQYIAGIKFYMLRIWWHGCLNEEKNWFNLIK